MVVRRFFSFVLLIKDNILLFRRIFIIMFLYNKIKYYFEKYYFKFIYNKFSNVECEVYLKLLFIFLNFFCFLGRVFLLKIGFR